MHFGSGMTVCVGTDSGCFLTVFPLMTPSSGPYIAFARCASADVMGQSLIKLLSR